MALCFFRLRRADLLYIPIRKRASNITLPFMRALCAVLLLAIGIYTPPFPIPAFRWISSYNAPVFLVTEWEHSRPRPFCYCFSPGSSFCVILFPSSSSYVCVCVAWQPLFKWCETRILFLHLYAIYQSIYGLFNFIGNRHSLPTMHCWTISNSPLFLDVYRMYIHMYIEAQ
jgi:hypothetical protein